MQQRLVKLFVTPYSMCLFWMQTVAKQEELRRKQEQMRNEWQPPKSDSQSDEESDDDDLHRDEDLQM